MALSPVSIEISANLAVITVDNPPVNALSQAVRQGIVDCITSANNDDNVKAIILTCSGSTFIAGADISEFGKPPLEPHLPDVLKVIYTSPKPVIAAMFGTVLGGGFETALACHYRIAKTGTKVGLPEVTLGLIPGAGGTQMLPRAAGVETALDMITSGKPRNVEQLKDTGLLADIVTDKLLDAAKILANNVRRAGQINQAIPDKPVPQVDNLDGLLDNYRKQVAKRARGQQAPQLAIDSIENACRLSFEEGMKKEREYFLQCRASEQSAALRHAFFAEKAAAKYRPEAKVCAYDIDSVAVIGAGTMGSGIAMCFADAGIPVVLLEASADRLEFGLTALKGKYQQMLDKKRISEAQMQKSLGLVKGSCDYQDLATVDLVVEAAFESMEVKKDIFTKLDAICKPQAILASNTSYLNIDEIAAMTNRPENVIGMHFFSPANVMKLLEVVRGEKSSESAILTAMNLGKQIRKIPVLVGMCYGFVGNRMYAAYGREANMLLIEGASPEQVDNAMVDWGMAMGPLAVNDMSGIDIAYKARKENPDLPKDPLYFRAANMMVESGRLGQKTQAGFYLYDENGKRQNDDVVLEMFTLEAHEQGITRRAIDAEEIQHRLILALVNEGAKILEEGIATQASDIDAIWLNGYGFPRHKGGPMFFAHSFGINRVVELLERFYQESGKEWWKPADSLVEMVKQGKSFY
ncbi:enoyl-CoA hydratase/isomerase family protein [Paraneptunicella aestuarii]|uniref:3-hydroxyacyl-CoA dehydrogenase NAD-binding domain-containing protein n=1 Tax=Paraneptunicella aestuarii TaxID=2831148 RepID=UPI001E5A3DF2|nr:3-hydroxyacyl-CoA dehydrogenase NAD-binding domain-containing protein [Paraneptunicella aestuarii]UAA37443.1 enoyl-CoA hydratase/isomerase family protein [Paraneptunicella aestuarii]